MPEDELKAFNLKNTKAKYKTLKCDPEIVKLIKKMHERNLDEQKYPYVRDTR